MKRALKEIKRYMMTIHTSYYTQLSNYIILIMLAAFVKIFLITKIHGEIFVTGFETCVWAFMMIWLILRALHSFNMLQGYYSFAGCFALLFILIGTSNTYLLYVSMAIVIIGKIIEVKDLFANVATGEGGKDGN